MAFFAVQVRTGKEIKAKEMIKYIIKNTSMKETSFIKSIYAGQTYTEYVSNEHREIPDISDVSQNDIFAFLLKDSIQDGISNMQKQYEGVKNHNDDAAFKIKQQLRNGIKGMQRTIEKITAGVKKLKSLLSGYILVELKMDSLYLPDNLWHLIKTCPMVVSIPSKYNIPVEEIEGFFEMADTEPEIEIQFEKVKTVQETLKKQREAIHKTNVADDMEKKKSYIEEAEELDSDLTEDVGAIKEKTNLIKCLKAFIKNKKEAVSMPVSLFEKLYPLRDHVLPELTPKNFLGRLKRLIQIEDMVVLE